MTGEGAVDRPLSQELAGLERMPGTFRQAAALAWLPGKGAPRFVLVTSRRTARWVFPKGGVDPGMTAPMAAAQEAREEAGVIGRPDMRMIGRFAACKIRPPQYWVLDVELYPVKIDLVLDQWAERDQRSRRFVTLDEARGMMDDPAMTDLAERFLTRDE